MLCSSVYTVHLVDKSNDLNYPRPTASGFVCVSADESWMAGQGCWDGNVAGYVWQGDIFLRSDFEFEFAKLYPYRKSTPCYINEAGSHRLRISLIWGVANSAYLFYKTHCFADKESHRYCWYRESLTLCTADTVSRRLPATLMRGVTVGELESIHWNFIRLPTPFKDH